MSLEGQLFDQKSLQAVTGKVADWNEIAKDCIAFANATGGRLLLGIEDGKTHHSLAAVLGEVMNRLSDNLRHIDDRWAIATHTVAGKHA